MWKKKTTTTYCHGSARLITHGLDINRNEPNSIEVFYLNTNSADMLFILFVLLASNVYNQMKMKLKSKRTEAKSVLMTKYIGRIKTTPTCDVCTAMTANRNWQKQLYITSSTGWKLSKCTKLLLIIASRNA